MKQKTLDLKRWERRWGFFFISPWFLGFLLFSVAPIIASLGFSFTDFNPANPDKASFVGAANWVRAFTQDQEAFAAVGKTILFILVCLPITFGVALALAIVLNSRLLLGKSLFRTLFYLPTMIPIVAAALIWLGILNPQTGWINNLIQAGTGLPAVGPKGILWYDSPGLVYVTFSLVTLWGVGNTFIIFLAGLQAVPVELYEAAEVDGASWWTKLIRITFPMLTPVLFFNLVVSLIGLLQYFVVPFILNFGNGYPDGSTNFIMVYFFKQSFSYLNMGYGSVLAWIIFLIGLIFTFILFRTQRSWVYYAGEKN